MYVTLKEYIYLLRVLTNQQPDITSAISPTTVKNIYSEDDLDGAVTSVRSGVPVCDAVRMFNVPRSTLAKHRRKYEQQQHQLK